MHKLYLVRHGQTLWNSRRRLQGRLDSPVTTSGIRQLRLLADRLSWLPIDLIYTSPSPRAMQSAEILAQPHELDIEPDKRLAEIHLGDWEGRAYSEIKKSAPEAFDAFLNMPNAYAPPPGGEDFVQLYRRVQSFLDQYAAGPDHCVLAVTHGMTLRAFYAILSGHAPDDIPAVVPRTASFCQATYAGGKWQLQSFDDTAHLSEGYGQWYYASPLMLTSLDGEQIVTPIPALARAWAMQPEQLRVSLQGEILHDGAEGGFLYRLANTRMPGDLLPRPNSLLPDGYEWIATRPMQLELIEQIQPAHQAQDH